jgi:hypothetical protein
METYPQTDMATGEVMILIFFITIPIIITCLFIAFRYYIRPKHIKTYYTLSVSEKKILNKYYLFILNPISNYLKLLNILYLFALLSLLSPIGWLCLLPNTYLYFKIRKIIHPLDRRFNSIPFLADRLCDKNDISKINSIMDKMYGISSKDYQLLINEVSKQILLTSDKLCKKQPNHYNKSDAILFVGYFAIITIEKAVESIQNKNIQNSLSKFRYDLVEHTHALYFNDTKEVIAYYNTYDDQYKNFPLSNIGEYDHESVFIWSYSVNELGPKIKLLNEIKYIISMLLELSTALSNNGVISSEYFENQYINLYEIEIDEDQDIDLEDPDDNYYSVDDEDLENAEQEGHYDEGEESLDEEEPIQKEPYDEDDMPEDAQDDDMATDYDDNSEDDFRHLTTVVFSDKRKLVISQLQDGRIWINDYRTGYSYSGYVKKGFGFNLNHLTRLTNYLERAVNVANYSQILIINKHNNLAIESDTNGYVDVKYCYAKNGMTPI